MSQGRHRVLQRGDEVKSLAAVEARLALASGYLPLASRRRTLYLSAYSLVVVVIIPQLGHHLHREAAGT